MQRRKNPKDKLQERPGVYINRPSREYATGV